MKRTAVIGLGSISVVHLAALTSGSYAKIEAICDIKPERIEAAKAQIPYAVKGYTDYKALLAEVKPEVVHICTPHYLHAPMCIDAMRAGADVYLEKPAALDYEEGLTILAVQKETGKQVCVSFQNRVVPTSLEAKRIVDSGELGAFRGARGFMTWKRTGGYYTDSDWRGRWATEGGGVLMNQSIHTLDLLGYFGGGVAHTEGRFALHGNRGITEVEDTAEALLTYNNGAHGLFYASDCNALDAPVMIELYLEKGRLLLQNDKLYRDTGSGYAVIVDDADAIKVGKAVWGNGHAFMIERFYNSLEGNAQPYCTLADGLQVLRVIGGIYNGKRGLPIEP